MNEQTSTATTERCDKWTGHSEPMVCNAKKPCPVHDCFCSDCNNPDDDCEYHVAVSRNTP